MIAFVIGVLIGVCIPRPAFVKDATDSIKVRFGLY